MKKGDKIKYTYEHHLNSRSTTIITKHGIFIREVKNRNGKSGKCVVRFEGNKGNSTVYQSQLKIK